MRVAKSECWVVSASSVRREDTHERRKRLEERKSEERIQQEMILYLQSEGLWAVHVSNEAGGRSRIEMARQRSMGLRAGFPDLLVSVPQLPVGHENRYIHLEVKTPKGVVSKVQLLMHRFLGRMFDTPVYIVRSVDDVRAIVEPMKEQMAWERFGRSIPGKGGMK